MIVYLIIGNLLTMGWIFTLVIDIDSPESEQSYEYINTNFVWAYGICIITLPIIAVLTIGSITIDYLTGNKK